MKLYDLIQKAKEASKSAYCPYSNFRVGAVIETDAGVFSGCNIENASYGLTICAERNAIFRAVRCGATIIHSVVIYTPTSEPTAPCGACRQVIREFASHATMIYSASDGDSLEFMSLEELLPYSFGPENLNKGTTK